VNQSNNADITVEVRRNINAQSVSITELQGSELRNVSDGLFNGVISSSVTPHSEDSYAEFFRILKPEGAIILRELILKNASNTSSISPDNSCEKITLRQEKDIFLSLTKSGFVNIQTKFSVNEDFENFVNILKESTLLDPDLKKQMGLIEITATKPSWSVGSSNQIKFPLNLNKNKIVQPVSQDKREVWTLSAEDINENDLEDEDNLLEAEDLSKPKKRDDCELGRGGVRKACKNCSCGRSKEWDPASDKKKETTSVKSSCGNCYLGDAFRCSTCPYLGQPAFKPGEKIQLSLDSVDI